MKRASRETLLSTKRTLETPIFNVSDSWILDPAGNKLRRIVVEHGGSTVVMPVNESGEVLMVHQYRYPARQYLWELPAGGIEKDETALAAAKRELREETGYTARRWKKLISFYPSPGFQQEQMTIFGAWDLRPGEVSPDHDEHLEIAWRPVAWIEDGIRKGRIRDGKTIIAMYALRLFA